MTNVDVAREAIEERDRVEQAYHDLANNMIYEGNSISWTKSKADNYGAALGEAWGALKEAGIKCDGQKTVTEGIRELAEEVAYLQQKIDDSCEF